MSIIHSTDPDFRVCWISFDMLLEIQLEAEAEQWGTRWTSVDALRGQVRDGRVLLQSLMREKWNGVIRTYRCLVVFSAVNEGPAGGITTIDLSPARYASLERLGRDQDAQQAVEWMVKLALNGISMLSKD